MFGYILFVVYFFKTSSLVGSLYSQQTKRSLAGQESPFWVWGRLSSSLNYSVEAWCQVKQNPTQAPEPTQTIKLKKKIIILALWVASGRRTRSSPANTHSSDLSFKLYTPLLESFPAAASAAGQLVAVVCASHLCQHSKNVTKYPASVSC